MRPSVVFGTSSVVVPFLATAAVWWRFPDAFAWRKTRQYKFSFQQGYAAYTPGYGWAAIPRIPVSNLTSDTFEREFVRKRRPLIITQLVRHGDAMSMMDLLRSCPDVNIDFANHYLLGLRLIPELIHSYLDSWLQTTFASDTSLTVSSIIADRSKSWNLGSWATALEQHANMTVRAKRYQWIVDYVWPPTVHGILFTKSLERQCPELSTIFRGIFKRAARLFKRRDNGSFNFHVDGMGMQRDIYAAPAGSRAYPLHQHGMVNENFLFMIAGTKHAVVFPPSADVNLCERPELATEFGDRAFMCEAFNDTTDFETQPSLMKVRGAEGEVHSGEVLYIPANTIHAVQNKKDVVAVAVHVPAGAPVFGENAGSHIEECDVLNLTHPRKPGFQSGIAWRLWRSLFTRRYFHAV